MGLDIYLYKMTAPKAQIEKENEAWEAETTRIYDTVNQKYNNGAWTDEIRAEYKGLINAAALTFGRVGEYDHHPHEAQIEIDSKTDAEHLFKIGYFRSSYNPGGIHHKLAQCKTHSLEEMFGGEGKYEFQPDWATAKARALEAIEAMKREQAETGGVAVAELSANMFAPVSDVDEVKAMAIYRDEKKRSEQGGSGDYSNLAGEFHFKTPMVVRAAIHGKNHIGKPATFLIYEQEGGLEWYIKALQIVVETCDFVMADKPELYWLHWSG